MKFTNLTVTKTAPNEFLIDVQTYSALQGLLRNSYKWESYVSSVSELQAVLSTFPNRDCQRTGTSTRVAHRFRSTRVGDLCFTVRWDGDANGYPGKKAPVERPEDLAWELLPFSFNLNDVVKHASARNTKRDKNGGKA